MIILSGTPIIPPSPTGGCDSTPGVGTFLTWTPVGNVLYYRVYRGTVDCGPYEIIATNVPQPSYADGPENLDVRVDYFYVVTAVTLDGESIHSNEYHAFPPTLPSTPIPLAGVVT